MAALALIRNYREWLNVWVFLVPLSALQLFPDWFLATELGVIVFPDTGSPTIGPIPVFMAGMWTIPLFIIIWAGRRAEERRGKGVAQIAVAVLSGLIFVASEATLWRIPIWWAQGVTTIGGVGIYLIVPEIVLGLSAFWAYKWSETRSIIEKLWAAFVVMLIYIGGLSFFYLVVEELLLG
jgi:hypothetical protein